MGFCQDIGCLVGPKLLVGLIVGGWILLDRLHCPRIVGCPRENRSINQRSVSQGSFVTLVSKIFYMRYSYRVRSRLLMKETLFPRFPHKTLLVSGQASMWGSQGRCRLTLRLVPSFPSFGTIQGLSIIHSKSAVASLKRRRQWSIWGERVATQPH